MKRNKYDFIFVFAQIKNIILKDYLPNQFLCAIHKNTHISMYVYTYIVFK